MEMRETRIEKQMSVFSGCMAVCWYSMYMCIRLWNGGWNCKTPGLCVFLMHTENLMKWMGVVNNLVRSGNLNECRKMKER